ncbi:MAG: coiled-coil domain-containing protein [Solirubrobacteraceae bacterium]
MTRLTPLPRRRPNLPALGVGAACVTAIVAWPSAATGQADLQTRAQSLRSQVEAESRRIAATESGLADAQARVATLEARVAERKGQLEDAQNRLVRSRIRLTRLEHKADRSAKTLGKNLRAVYESGRPDLLTVILNSNGFSDVLERLEFYRRISEHNGRILEDTREARKAVAGQTVRLEGLRKTYRKLAEDAEVDRNQADVVKNALLRRRAAQLERRNGTQSRLRSVRSQISRLEAQQAEAARAARERTSATRDAPSVSAPSGDSSPSSSGGGGDAKVSQVVSAANDIASTPYVWGGGHGGGRDSGYDCSGSLSYALAAAGLLSTPLDSTGFMSWGEAGPGRRITVYANAGHAYMVVDGRRFDTSALRSGGTRWTSEMRSSAGFVARHPPGL